MSPLKIGRQSYNSNAAPSEAISPLKIPKQESAEEQISGLRPPPAEKRELNSKLQNIVLISLFFASLIVNLVRKGREL